MFVAGLLSFSNPILPESGSNARSATMTLVLIAVVVAVVVGLWFLVRSAVRSANRVDHHAD